MREGTMVAVLILVGVFVAVFVGHNVGGATTGPAFGPAVGADAISKTWAAALMTIFFFSGPGRLAAESSTRSELNWSIVATETIYTLIATQSCDQVCSDLQWLL